MKKYLLPLLLLAAPAFAAQQEITAVPDSPVLPSIGALKDAVNLRLADIDENFDEIYPILAAGPVYVNTTAPANTKVVWIDTDQGNSIKVYVGGVWTVVGSGGIAGDDLGSAAYSDVVALWTTCSGYLKSDGTCDTPSGSFTYPDAGVPNSTGSAWGTSYTVGTAANNLVQLNGTAQLPAVSADLLTITDTNSRFTTDTVGAALQELGGAPELLFGTEFTETAGVGTVTVTLDFPVTSEVYGTGWATDTEGAQRDDVYAEMETREKKQPSTLNLTTDTSITADQLLANRYISNQGASGEVDITLPAVSYSISRTVLITEAQIAEINPPSGEAFDLDGTALNTDYCIDSPATVGAKAVFTRMQDASGTWFWSVDTVRGTWVDTGASD